jgi:hypothetical protein
VHGHDGTWIKNERGGDIDLPIRIRCHQPVKMPADSGLETSRPRFPIDHGPRGCALRLWAMSVFCGQLQIATLPLCYLPLRASREHVALLDAIAIQTCYSSKDSTDRPMYPPPAMVWVMREEYIVQAH